MDSLLEVFGSLPGAWEPFEDPAIWEFILRGLWVTLRMSATAITLSLLFGTILALLRVSPIRPVSWAATTYIELVRALPSFLIIFYTFLMAPKIGLDLSGFWAGVTGLTLYTSAVMAEIVRAGIHSVQRSVVEASRSLGLSYLKTMRLVVLPIALRRMVPSLVSQAITLNKDTSLTALVTVQELTFRGRILFRQYFNPVETLLVIALLYFAVNYILSLLTRRLEARYS